MPLPHVPGKQGNRLPVGEGCWLCGINTIEKAQLEDVISQTLHNKHRERRELQSTRPNSTVERFLSKPIRITVNASLTSTKDDIYSVLTLLSAYRHNTKEHYRIFGDIEDKFQLVVDDDKVILFLKHKVVDRSNFKLVLMISNEEPSEDLVLLPVEINVIP